MMLYKIFRKMLLKKDILLDKMKVLKQVMKKVKE
jgi:hypothetical protein